MTIQSGRRIVVGGVGLYQVAGGWLWPERGLVFALDEHDETWVVRVDGAPPTGYASLRSAVVAAGEESE